LGQQEARLALEFAAAGGHHLAMIGPPGAGKTMLATRLPSVLPLLDDEQALEVTAVHSVAEVSWVWWRL
jgi:magnesium chelatase family protein